MKILVNKLTIELYQEADNIVGSEHAEIIANPCLIGLWENEKNSHYYTFKSEDGFSFEDKNEVLELFNKIDEIIKLTK